ncbi:unnamed protein product, partial [Mesorhabditis spiculigera]
MREKMNQGDVKLNQEAERLRKLAVTGVAFSVIAAFVCILTVPIVYNYVQSLHSVLQNELDYCKSRSTSLWQQVSRTQRAHGETRRAKRDYLGYSDADVELEPQEPRVHPEGMVLMEQMEYPERTAATE